MYEWTHTQQTNQPYLVHISCQSIHHCSQTHKLQRWSYIYFPSSYCRFGYTVNRMFPWDILGKICIGLLKNADKYEQYLYIFYIFFVSKRKAYQLIIKQKLFLVPRLYLVCSRSVSWIGIKSLNNDKLYLELSRKSNTNERSPWIKKTWNFTMLAF